MITTTTRGRMAATLRRLAARLEGMRGRLILVKLAPVDLDRRELRIVAEAVATEADRQITRLLEARRVVRSARERATK